MALTKEQLITRKNGLGGSDIAALLGFYGIKTSIKQKISSGTRFPNGKVYDKTYETYSLRIMGRKSIEHFRELFKSVLIYKQEQLDNQLDRKSVV